MQGRTIPFVVALLPYLFVASQPAYGGIFGPTKSNAWHEKYTTPGTLGAELETDFGKLLGVCGAGILDTKYASYSSIPAPLQSALQSDLDKQVHSLNGPSSAVLFRYVFQQPTLAGFSATDPSKQLPSNMLDMSDVPTPVPGLSSKIYSQTCGSIIAAAVSVKLTPPVATVQAALDNQFKSNNSISIVSGTFYSPLYGILTDPAAGTDRLAALLALWQYYRSNPTQASTTLYYLSGFNGMAAFFMSGRSFSQQYDVKATGSGNWLIASMDAKLDANLKAESKLTINDYVTIAARKFGSSSDDIAFKPLPTPKQIADEFSHRSAIFKPVDQEYVRQNAPFRHYFELRGIPQAMCQGNNWIVASPVARITYDDARFEEGACRFYAHYDAPDDLNNVPPSITYRIKAVNDLPPNELAFDVTFHPVTTKHPIPTVSDFQKRPSLVTSPTGERLLRWTIPIRFVDSQDPVNMSLRPPVVTNASLSCGGAPSEVTATAAPDGNNPGVVLTVDRKLAGNETVDSSRDKDCSLVTSIMVALAPSGMTQRDAVRAVNTSVMLPFISVPVAPPASPMGTPSSGTVPSGSQ